MVSLIEVIILGIVQGITEWLPVSSSGHLVLAQEIFKVEQPLVLDIMLHFGTLIVILVVFRQDFVKILKALVKRDFQSEDGKLAVFLVIGTIPVAVAGVVFYDTVNALFQNALAVSIALLFTGFLLFASERRENNKPLTPLNALLIGIAQAVALIPGISRSGSTISTGLLQGIDKQKAFKFSFLLAAPAILGATIYELYKIRTTLTQNIDWTATSVGVIVSMLISYFALKALLKIFMHRKFHYFAIYCWVLGAVVLTFLLL